MANTTHERVTLSFELENVLGKGCIGEQRQRAREREQETAESEE
jgi:hypothetical protein